MFCPKCSVRLQIVALLWCFTTIQVHGDCLNRVQTLTSPRGLITHVSGSHLNGESCIWIIAPGDAKSVTLSFSRFQTDSCCDFVCVYSCSDASCNSTSKHTNSPVCGFSVPSEISSSTGIMKVEYKSDGSPRYSGFAASYKSTTFSACPTGQYTGSDGGCYSCSNKPDNSFYTSNGGIYSAGCAWQCNSGYYQTRDGSCSYGYVKIRSRCSIGQYLNSYGSCMMCTNKPEDAHYTSTSNGGTFTEGCSWSCDDGYILKGSVCILDPFPTPESVQNSDSGKAVKGVSAVFGLLLLIPMLVIAVIFRATDNVSLSEAANQQLRCCICYNTFNSRRIVQGVSWVLAALTLIFTIAADAQICKPSSKLALAAIAYFLHFAGGIAMYSLSACGCSLCCPARACCVCPHDVCNRTMQATSAIGFSICFWIIAQFLFVYDIVALDSAKIASRLGMGACPLEFVAPPGLVSIAGTFNAAALILQGHFVSLVPQALANLYEPAAAQRPAATQAPQQVLAPPQDNTQFNVLVAEIYSPAAAEATTAFPIPWRAVPAVPQRTYRGTSIASSGC